jgi:hypothetical protein
MNLVDKRITELEKRVSELETLLNDHCIMTTGEPAVHKEPPKHDVAREPFMDTINRKVFGAKQEPEDSITISRRVAEEWVRHSDECGTLKDTLAGRLADELRQSLSDKKSKEKV